MHRAFAITLPIVMMTSWPWRPCRLWHEIYQQSPCTTLHHPYIKSYISAILMLFAVILFYISLVKKCILTATFTCTMLCNRVFLYLTSLSAWRHFCHIYQHSLKPPSRLFHTHTPASPIHRDFLLIVLLFSHTSPISFSRQNRGKITASPWF